MMILNHDELSLEPWWTKSPVLGADDFEDDLMGTQTERERYHHNWMRKIKEREVKRSKL